MKLIRKHLIGIICFIIAILYVLIIALNIKETKKETKEDLSKYKVLYINCYCKSINLFIYITFL